MKVFSINILFLISKVKCSRCGKNYSHIPNVYLVRAWCISSVCLVFFWSSFLFECLVSSWCVIVIPDLSSLYASSPGLLILQEFYSCSSHPDSQRTEWTLPHHTGLFLSLSTIYPETVDLYHCHQSVSHSLSLHSLLSFNPIWWYLVASFILAYPLVLRQAWELC